MCFIAIEDLYFIDIFLIPFILYRYENDDPKGSLETSYIEYKRLLLYNFDLTIILLKSTEISEQNVEQLLLVTK